MKKRIMALSALLLGVTSMVILTACAGQPTDVARTQEIANHQVTSLRTYLTPDSEKYSSTSYSIEWLADVDGTYGENPDGIFFFTKDGTYVEWTGTYLYSTTPITSITE